MNACRHGNKAILLLIDNSKNTIAGLMDKRFAVASLCAYPCSNFGVLAEPYDIPAEPGTLTEYAS